MLFGGVTVPGRPDLANLERLDRLPVPMLRRMMRGGMAIDREHFRELGAKFRGEIAELERDIESYVPAERLAAFSKAGDEETDFNANSPDQIARLLYDVLKIGKKKQIRKTASGRQSTGKRQLELVRLEHPIVPKVLRHRELSKLVSTYADSLPDKAVFHPHGADCPRCGLTHAVPSWRVHGELGTTRAETGRINHKKPNLGNIPNRTEDGRAIQAGFIAPEGRKIVARDLKGIELRTLAHVANEPTMIEMFRRGEDLHDRTSRRIFGLKPDEQPDKLKHRVPAKAVAFSVANGTTGRGIYLGLVMNYGVSRIPVPSWLTEDWCEWLLEQFLREYNLTPYFEQQHYRARRYGFVWDPFGRTRWVPEIASCHESIRSEGLRKSQNLPITSMAAGQLKLAMGRADETLEPLFEEGRAWPLNCIHDSIMIESDDDAVAATDACLAESMNTCMIDRESGENLFRCPIESDGTVSQRWEK
jgi:DNA polymerase I